MYHAHHVITNKLSLLITMAKNLLEGRAIAHPAIP